MSIKSNKLKVGIPLNFFNIVSIMFSVWECFLINSKSDDDDVLFARNIWMNIDASCDD